MDSTCSSGRNWFRSRRLKSSGLGLSPLCFTIILFACAGLAGCGSTTSSSSPSANSTAPAITSFTANPTSVTSGSSSTLSWATAERQVLPSRREHSLPLPQRFDQRQPDFDHDLHADRNECLGLDDLDRKSHSSLRRTTGDHDHFVPGGTQGAAYAGCTIPPPVALPRTHSVSTNANFPPLPEGMSFNPSTGASPVR